MSTESSKKITSEEAVEIIAEELGILEILKKYLYYDNKNYVIKMKDIRESEFNFDFEILKDWL